LVISPSIIAAGEFPEGKKKVKIGQVFLLKGADSLC